MSNNNRPSLSGKSSVVNEHQLKPTDYVKSWIEYKAREDRYQTGITPQEMPNIVFTRKEVLAMPEELTAGRRTVTYKYLGICFCRARTILINVKKHTSYADSKHTIVHELVHYRFRYLKHGKEFEKRIFMILGGKSIKLKICNSQNPPLMFWTASNQEFLEMLAIKSEDKHRKQE